MGNNAAFLALAALLLTSVAAREDSRQLSCPPSIIKDVPAVCSDSGTVLAGSNVTYQFPIEQGGETFDLVLTLHPQSGDADLVVDLPSGLQLVSKHGSGEDVVFIPRARVAAGQYTVTVVGATDESRYKLVVEKHTRQRRLAPEDRAALQQILDGPCCARLGACTTLRNGLIPPPANSSDDSSDELARLRLIASSDLCNMGQNLCDPEGHLLRLALFNEYMSCPFPGAQLSELTRLTFLDLTMNDLTGSLQDDVVPALKQLPDLQNLLLSHNKLEGGLTCGLATPSLAELGLAANQLQGTLPTCLLESPAIQELYLANNDLEGPLPQPPPGSKLLIISAHGMRLTGPLPDFSALPQLQALQLHNNQLTGKLPGMSPAIRHLDLSYNQLSGSIPEQWGELEGLEFLRLQHNALTGALPAGLARLPAVELMQLSHNQLSGALPEDWRAPRLQRLDLQHNSLSGVLPGTLGALPTLSVLQLSNNRLGGGLQPFARAVPAPEGANKLRYLALQDNQLTGPVPAELQRLDLFSGTGGFALLDGISVPGTLDLGNNRLSGPFPSWVVVELVGNKVAAVNLAGNSLTCLSSPIMVESELKYNRLLGLECVAPDGGVVQVASLVRVGEKPGAPTGSGNTPQQQHGEHAGPDGGSSGSGAGGSTSADTSGGGTTAGGEGEVDASESGQGNSSRGGGMPAWAIALTVLGSLAVTAALVAACCGPRLYQKLQAARARRYQTYQDEPGSHASHEMAAAAVAAKQRAVALAELGGGSGSLPGKPGKADGDSELLGTWGMIAAAAGGDAGSAAGEAVEGRGVGAGAGTSSAATSAATSAGQTFQIGTRVHHPEADMV